MNAHPQSRADRRNMKFKRGEYAKKAPEDKELTGLKLSKFKDIIRDQETENVLHAAKEGKVIETVDL